MLLSEAAALAEMTVVRDGAFSNLGFLMHRFEGMLTFAENGKRLPEACANATVTALITLESLQYLVPESLALAVCAQPRFAFATLHNRLAAEGFYWPDFETEIHPSAQVHPRAWVAPRNVRIGAGTKVEANAAILERCTLAEEVHVGAGAVLGGQGFQTARTPESLLEMDHAGGLEIQRGARIFPGAVVATGLFRHDTTIGEQARVGSQAFVSHGVQIGARSFIGHGAVVNGGVEIGSDAWIGPGSVLAQQLFVGDRAKVSLGAVVIGDVPPSERVSGNFAVRHRALLRHMAQLESSKR